MSPEEHRDLVRERFAAWEHGDSRPFFEIVADDVTWTVIGSTEISGTYQSKAAFLAGAGNRLFDRLTSRIVATIDDVLVDGDRVVVTWKGRASGKNGRSYEQTYCWLLTMADGQVIEATAYLDTEMVTAMFAPTSG